MAIQHESYTDVIDVEVIEDTVIENNEEEVSAESSIEKLSGLDPDEVIKLLLKGKGKSTVKQFNAFRYKHVLNFVKEYHLEVSGQVIDLEKEFKRLSFIQFSHKYARFIVIWASENLALESFQKLKASLRLLGVSPSSLLGISYKGAVTSPGDLPAISPDNVLSIIKMNDNGKEKSDRNIAMLAFIVGTGGRRLHEARELKWRDVKFDDFSKSFVFQIQHTKTGKSLYVEMAESSSFFPYFYTYHFKYRPKNSNLAVFPVDEDGNHLSENGIAYVISTIIKLPSHSLRTGAIFAQLEDGKTLDEVARNVGHSSTRTTEGYAYRAQQYELAQKFKSE